MEKGIKVNTDCSLMVCVRRGWYFHAVLYWDHIDKSSVGHIKVKNIYIRIKQIYMFSTLTVFEGNLKEKNPKPKSLKC